MAELTRYQVLDDKGLDVLLASVFGIVENNYVRRSVFDEKIAELEARLNASDAFETYPFEIDTSSGNLSLSVPDGEDVDLSINSEGYLILNSNDTPADKAVAAMSFNINEKGSLIVTI